MIAADIEALQLGHNKIGIPARLLLKFTAHKTASKVYGFRLIEAWPAELVLGRSAATAVYWSERREGHR
eukprot:5503482-Prymnesium_polylepis.1